MLLTISTTHEPATDIGFLLHKHPDRVHSARLGFGRATVFYPEATPERTTAALVADVDPVELARNKKVGSRGNEFSLGQYVNDRPYAASSFLSVAMSKVFGSALAGRCESHPELATMPIDLEFHLPVIPCVDGKELLIKLFAPLGYEVECSGIELDQEFPNWGLSKFFDVRLRTKQCLKDALEHLFVLIPVLDGEKHYWVGQDEVEKLLRKGGDWLASHPEKELITHRYLRRDRQLANEAIQQLLAEFPEDPDDAQQSHDKQELEVEKPLSLNEERIASVIRELNTLGGSKVIDLGCGEGKLLQRLLTDGRYERVVGMDVSFRVLQRAARKLHIDTMTPRQRERIDLLQGSLTYRDKRLQGFDIATVVEVIEHLDQSRLETFERVVFGHARPGAVVVTTPNSEYNSIFESLPAGDMRHHDHRFEWTREEFERWANRVAARNDYEVTFNTVGPIDKDLGSPTQMAVFRR